MVIAIEFGIVVCEFKIQSRYYVHFWTLVKVWTPLSSQLWVKIVPLLFFETDDFGIQKPTKVNMPLKQRNQTYHLNFFTGDKSNLISRDSPEYFNRSS